MRWLAIFFVRVYQWCISPFLPNVCKYEPTCSHYTIEAIEKYGVVRGVLKGVWRILRCNPWSRGGYDPP
ncbi:MAG: membrane protein insertion efficiency factor YidD [Thermoguttaceae bacterium]